MFNEKKVDLIEARLDKIAADIVASRANDFGYPMNLTSCMLNFYKWFQGSGLNLGSFSNAGDPFDDEACNHGANTLLIEREVIEKLGPLYGFDKDNIWGIVTNSGTDGNNHGIYFGAKYLKKKTNKKPILYTSDAAHYSGRRLADLQNLDMKLIPSDVHGCMIPKELEKALLPGQPALMLYAIGTTFKGGVDKMDDLNKVLAGHTDIAVYRHLDAALFGGYLPYTKYSDIVNRKERIFDSISVSGHKFFGIDETSGIFLTTMDIKNVQNSYEVSYLNCSMPMINCSRSALTPLKFWWILQHTSREDFIKQSETFLDRAAWLKNEFDIMKWPAWIEPMSNTVYFKSPSKELVKKYNLASDFDSRLGGSLSHIVVMQHVSEKKLRHFLDEIASSI